MDEKQRSRFLLGEVNAMETPCIITRERINSKLDYWYVEERDSGIQFLKGVRKNTPLRPRHAVGEETDTTTLEEEESIPNPKLKLKPARKPFSTGGKPAYSKVYISKLVEMPRDKLSFDLLGKCIFLTTCMEWETGLLKIGKGGKRRCMTQKDIGISLGIGTSATSAVLKQLKSIGIIIHEESKYKFNLKFFAKGRVFDEIKARKGNDS